MPFSVGSVRTGLFSFRFNASIQSNTIIRNTSKRFFHAHSPVRPQVRPPLTTAADVLWSYFKAPSNVVFLTTNLIGLGILSSYRTLSTLANSESKSIEDVEIDKASLHALEWNFTSNEFIPTKARNKNDGKILSAIESDVFREEERVSESVEYVTEGLFIDKSIYLPLTESELDELGPPRSRDLSKERLKMVLVNYLLMIQYFYGSLRSIFGSKLDISDESLLLLSETHRNAVLKTLLEYVDKDKITDFESFRNLVPSEIIGLAVSSYPAPGIKNQLLKRSDGLDIDNYDFMENDNVQPMGQSFKPKFDQLIKDYKNRNTLESEFFLEAANLIMRSSLATSDYGLMISKLVQNPENVNFNTLSNIIGIFLMKNKNIMITETTLTDLMKSSTYSLNESLFESCLRHLNLEREAILYANRKARATKRIRSMATGSSLKNYSYSLQTYCLALKGLMKFHPTEEKYVLGATKRVLYEMEVNGKNRLRVNFIHTKAKEAKLINPKVWTLLPPNLVELCIKIGLEFKNISLLRSAIGMMEKSKHIDDNMYIEMLEKIEERTDLFEDEKFMQTINELKASKLNA